MSPERQRALETFFSKTLNTTPSYGVTPANKTRYPVEKAVECTWDSVHDYMGTHKRDVYLLQSALHCNDFVYVMYVCTFSMMILYLE